jgi:ferric-dicitrate binding protein FerR (iron transport regulator)
VGDTRYATEAARILAAARGGAVAPPSADSREKAIAALASAMGERRRLRWQGRVSAIAVAAAAAIALGVEGVRFFMPAEGSTTVVATEVGTGARLYRAGRAGALDAGGTVAAGDRVSAGTGVAMRLSTGTTLAIEPSSELQIVDAGPAMRLALLRGAVQAKVAKLHPGERFVVATPDAEIEVRGTAFRLAASADTVCDEPSSTRLEVFEGVVAVRRGSAVTLVGAGGVWPSGCHRRPAAEAPSVAPAAPVAQPVEPRPRRLAVRAPALPPPTPAPDPGSTLAEQNDLFGRAVAARRAGDRQGALERFLELERRFPSSPLGEASMVERMRLVAGRDRDAGRAIAREYLARYPEGFAGAEARALMREPAEPRQR